MKNFQHIWSVVCQESSIDATSNILSLFKILEKIDVNIKEETPFDAKKPLAVPFNFEVVSYWRKLVSDKPVEGEAKVAIYSSNGIELASVPIKFQIPANAKSSRTIVKINGLPIVGSGEYKVEVQEKKGREHLVVAEIPFDVVIHKNK